MSNDSMTERLDVLRCPISRARLSLLSRAETSKVCREIEDRKRLHRGGKEVPRPIEMAIGTEDRQYVYRVEEGIFWLLPELALVRSSDKSSDALAPEKRDVQAFYDEFGWVQSEPGVFNDTAAFTDVRSVSRVYREACNARIARCLSGGRFLLDVASGAIPHPEYLQFSSRYETRICVDFSILALREAKRQLGGHGLFLLADISRLPLAGSSIDDVISLHTIYHLPPAEQAPAIDELVRVARPGGKVVVVYVWSYSLAMAAAFAVRGALGRIRRMGRAPQVPPAVVAPEVEPRTLYFQPQNHVWFLREVASRHAVKLRVWSSVSTAFQERFVPKGLLGSIVFGLIRLFERAFPRVAGRFGMYPMFVIERSRR